MHSLKLSPNLRKLCVSDEEKKEGEEETNVDGDTLQHSKMMKVLASLGGGQE